MATKKGDIYKGSSSINKHILKVISIVSALDKKYVFVYSMSLNPVFNTEQFQSIPRGSIQSNAQNASQVGSGNAAKTIYISQSTIKGFYVAQNPTAPQGPLFQYKSQQERIAALQGKYIFNIP